MSNLFLIGGSVPPPPPPPPPPSQMERKMSLSEQIALQKQKVENQCKKIAQLIS